MPYFLCRLDCICLPVTDSHSPIPFQDTSSVPELVRTGMEPRAGTPGFLLAQPLSPSVTNALLRMVFLGDQFTASSFLVSPHLRDFLASLELMELHPLHVL